MFSGEARDLLFRFDLREDGYDVVLARSGEEALELLAVQPVDCTGERVSKTA